MSDKEITAYTLVTTSSVCLIGIAIAIAYRQHHMIVNVTQQAAPLTPSNDILL